MDEDEIDWWDRIGHMTWQHVVLTVVAITAFVVLCFAPSATCRFQSGDTTTTTTVQR